MAIDKNIATVAGSLYFRILAPVIPIILLMALLGGAVFSLGMRTVSHYANERILGDLERDSRSIYNICDTTLQNLQTKELPDADIAIRLRKANALGDIEKYAREHVLQVIIFDPQSGKNLLQKTDLPIQEVIDQTRAEGDKPFVKISHNDDDYYAREFDFELWNWRIIIVREGKIYEEFASTIKQGYLAIGIILIIVSVILVLYFRRVIHKPVRTIIAAIQGNEMPNYKGIYEFEFLSNVIRESKEKEQEKQLEISYQASHDELTGLINRREFERCLRGILTDVRKQSGSHTILYLDLDQFKIVNDTCGHHAGDSLLQQLTRILKEKLRQNDVLARLGGDEFGVLLRNCAAEPALRVAESLRQAASEFRFAWDDKLFSVGVSIGLLTFSDDELNLNDILSIVDGACYLAKDKGRNRIHVYNPDDSELSERKNQMGWVAQISKALEEDRMVLFKQTIAPLQITSQKTVHFEVLLRMRDEEGKLLPPIAFLPAAERYNLMPTIDFWVVKTAFAYYRDHCTDPAIHYTCAINLSGATIDDERLVTYIREQFEISGIPPTGICFEITETAAIANLHKAVTLINDLKQIGCRFALDDFGSGMSSFGYLKNLPVDFIKIDGSFVKDMMHDRIDHAMVDAINKIGHVMGIETIAEFVEDDDIKAELQKMNVNFAQGYGIGRPGPLISQE